ncbi:MAG: helix-turn-helix domain-containing protein, partial [Anaerolineae bacterium]|nr:helix-turn-helix domain-containing protein [Anaerolineae bacterium]
MPVSVPSSTLEKFTTFGDLLRFLRRRVGITQMELAIEVGYSDTQISRLEQNVRLPDIPTIEARFVPALGLEDEPKAVARLLDLAANVRREDAPARGLCPYKGLNYFDEADADLFVGREVLTAKLVERVLSLTSSSRPNLERFLAIVGASGSGKSSLVRAGVVSSLRWNKTSADWHIHVLTPTAHPLESLAASLTHEGGSVTTIGMLMDDLARDPRSLHLFANRELQSRNGSRLLFVVDQFEESFALCRSDGERASFIGNLLTAASEANGQAVVVIALRADFYAHCAAYIQLREALAKHQEYIGAMNDEELRRAIEEPAHRGRWEFEPGLVDLLLHDVGHEPGALPLLSHALLETWQRRRGRVMTMSGYASSGGVRGAIAETAETVFIDQFTHEQQVIARRIFLRLTELSDETSTADTRRRATFNELILRPEEATTTHAVLKTLADARLITTSEDSAEVAHEALIREWPTLRGWLEDNREGLRLQRHLTEAAQEWFAMDREPDTLYRGARLSQAREWGMSHADEMNALEREFLTASIEFSEREVVEREAQRQRELEAAQALAKVESQRAEEQTQSANRLRLRNRIIITVGTIALVLAVLAGAFGLRSNENATQAETNLSIAQANAATAEAERQRADMNLATAQADFQRAEAQRLAAEANTLLQSGGNSELIALLSLRSLNIQYSPQGDAAVLGAATLAYPRQIFMGHTDAVLLVTFSPDGKYVLTSSVDKTARLWDAQTGHEVRRLMGHTDIVGYVAFSPDGKYVLTGSADKTARLWDVQTGAELRQFTGHADWVTGVAFSPDGKYALTGSADKTARLWDVQTGAELRQFAHAHVVAGVAFSPDGQYALTASFDGIARLWEVQTGTELRQFIHTAPLGGSVVFSPDGTLVLASSIDGTTILWDTGTGQEIRVFEGHTGPVYPVAFSPDGRYVLTGSDDKTARLWDAQTGQEMQRFLGHAGPVRGAAFSPDGRYVLTGSFDGTAKLWDSESKPELPVFTGHTNIIMGVAFSPDGHFLLTGSLDGTARLWEVANGQTLQVFTDTGPLAYGVAFTPDGQSILTGDIVSRIATLWDVRQTGKKLREFVGHSDAIISVAFSSDSRYILTASGGGEHMVRLWDVQTGQELRQ